MENSYTVHNSFELVADPVYFPIVIGNEYFFVMQQDRRSITDRRTWTVVRIFPPTENQPQPFAIQSNQIPLYQLIQQLLALVTFYPCPTTQTVERPIPVITQPFKFHYERQTSTDDLCYFQRMSALNSICHEPPVKRHVQFTAGPNFTDKAINTDEHGCTEQPMECDPGEGTSGRAGQTNFGCDNAYDLMKQNKERQGWFW